MSEIIGQTLLFAGENSPDGMENIPDKGVNIFDKTENLLNKGENPFDEGENSLDKTWNSFDEADFKFVSRKHARNDCDYRLQSQSFRACLSENSRI